ncbi:MAG: hypothetical protein QG603_485 [Patescibacteria group bacterium]|nr:hypothetical protein [Patescibacteria group bacterium]
MFYPTYKLYRPFTILTTVSGFFYDYLFYIKNKTLLYGQDFVKKSDFEIAISPEGMVNLVCYSKINNQNCQLLGPYFSMG